MNGLFFRSRAASPLGGWPCAGAPESRRPPVGGFSLCSAAADGLRLSADRRKPERASRGIARPAGGQPRSGEQAVRQSP